MDNILYDYDQTHHNNHNHNNHNQAITFNFVQPYNE